MNSTIYNGYSGIKSHQFGLDAVSNNIANINTNGYRANNPEFKSLFSNSINSNAQSPAKSDFNYGSTVASNAISSAQGSFIESDKELSVAIAGKGWFVLGDNEGLSVNPEDNGKELFFSRDGDFSRDAQGYIVNAAGYYMLGVDLGKVDGDLFHSNDDLSALNGATLSPIKIPLDLKYAPLATTKVNLSLNLNKVEASAPLDLNPEELEELFSRDFNSFLIDGEEFNPSSYPKGEMVIGGRSLSFTYGEPNLDNPDAKYFSSINDLKEILESQGLMLDFKRKADGTIDPALSLEISSLVPMDVKVGGEFFNRLGLSGEKILDALNLPSYSPDAKDGELMNIGGAIFKKLEDALVLLDSQALKDIKDRGEVEDLSEGELVRFKGRVYQRLDLDIPSDLSLDDAFGEEYFDLVADEARLTIEELEDEREFSEFDLALFGGRVYQKISDDDEPNFIDGVPNKKLWKQLDSTSLASKKMEIAGFIASSPFYDEDGNELNIESTFRLYKADNKEVIFDIKTAIKDRFGKEIASPPPPP